MTTRTHRPQEQKLRNSASRDPDQSAEKNPIVRWSIRAAGEKKIYRADVADFLVKQSTALKS